MNGATLVTALQHTLNPDRATRVQAEGALAQVHGCAGFLAELLKIAAADALDAGVRQASSIYFKNLVRREWSTLAGDSERPQLFSDEEKALVRDNLLETLIMAPPLVRAQMGLALTTIAYSDFPDRWPGLFPGIMANMRSGDENRTMGSLIAMRLLAKRFEFAREEQQTLNTLVTESFPVLSELWQHLLHTPQREDTFTMQKLICQVFWSATHHDVPAYLRKPTVFRPWMELFTTSLKQPVDVALDPEEAPLHPAWKTKKWVAECTFRLYQRYGDPKLVEKQTVKFAERFMKEFAIHFLRLFMDMLRLKNEGSIYLSDRVSNSALQYCALGIRYPNTYRVMKPELQAVVGTLILPFLCFNAADQALWEEDAAEFVRKENDFMGEFYDPRVAAGLFLGDLVVKKGKDCLEMTMQHFLQQLTAYATQDPAQRDCPTKHGIMLAVGTISPVLKKKKHYHGPLEELLRNHVLPEFQSPVGYLRARACWVYSQFSNIKFRLPDSLLDCVVTCLQDGELPVRVHAALALRRFLKGKQFTEQIRPGVQQLLEALFGLMNDIENESLVDTLETIVDKFPEQVAPLAVPCATQLAAAFASYVDREDDLESEDATMAAANCLSTLCTLLLSVHKVPDTFARLEAETPLLTLLAQNLQPERVEYLEETLDVIKCLTRYSNPISESLWQLFPLLLQAWQSFGYDYLEEFVPCIENYVTRSAPRFCASPQPKQMVLDMCTKVFQNEDATQGHLCSACQVMEAVFVGCQGHADEVVAPFIDMARGRLLGEQKSGQALRVMLLSVLLNACSYNAALAVQTMESLGDGILPEALHTLLGNLAEFSRIHDKKVVILGLSSLIGIAHMPLPEALANSLGLLLATTLRLVEQSQKQKAEQAAAAAAEKEAGGDEEEWEESEESDDEFEEDDGDGEDAGGDDGDCSDGEDPENEEDRQYLAMLDRIAMEQKVNEISDDWQEYEDILLDDDSSVLENVDEAAFVMGKMEALRQANAPAAHSLFNGLDQEHRTILEGLSS